MPIVEEKHGYDCSENMYILYTYYHTLLLTTHYKFVTLKILQKKMHKLIQAKATCSCINTYP